MTGIKYGIIIERGDSMSKWHSLLEYLQFPIKVLFFASVMLGIGSVITNPNLFFAHINNENIILIATFLQYAGGIIIYLFPFLVFIKILSRKFEASTPVFIGVMSYVIMNLTMMFNMNQTFPEYFYKHILGVTLNIQTDSMTTLTRSPYAVGIFGLIVCYYVTKFAYLKSRHYSMHGILSFIDHDTWAMLIAFALSIVAGLAFTIVWPFVIYAVQKLFEIIGSDITNPVNLFVYGIFERLSALCNMIEVPRTVFWFGELGGTWIDAAGSKYIGDVAIWTVQQGVNNINSAGRFITPYYIMNIFLIPSYILAYFSLVTGKKDKGRYVLFIALAILASIICGNALPVEVLMLILSPILYMVYLFIVGLIFAIMQIMNAYVGYSFSGSLLIANPGSLIDLIQYFRNPAMFSTLISIGVIGIIVAIFFFYATRQYFKKYAIGLFQLSLKDEVIQEVIQSLGGIENIISVESTPDKLSLQLHDVKKMDMEPLKEYGAYLILEADHGYLIRLGNISTMVGEEIKRQLAIKK